MSKSLALAALLGTKDELQPQYLPQPDAQCRSFMLNAGIKFESMPDCDEDIWNALRRVAESCYDARYVKEILDTKEARGHSLCASDFSQLIEIQVFDNDLEGVTRTLQELHNRGLQAQPQNIHGLIKCMLRLEEIELKADKPNSISLHDMITAAQDWANMATIQLRDATWVALIKRCLAENNQFELNRILQIVSNEDRSRAFQYYLSTISIDEQIHR